MCWTLDYTHSAWQHAHKLPEILSQRCSIEMVPLVKYYRFFFIWPVEASVLNAFYPLQSITRSLHNRLSCALHAHTQFFSAGRFQRGRFTAYWFKTLLRSWMIIVSETMLFSCADWNQASVGPEGLLGLVGLGRNKRITSRWVDEMESEYNRERFCCSMSL